MFCGRRPGGDCAWAPGGLLAAAKRGDRDQREAGQCPRREHADVPAGGGAVEEPGAAQQVAAGAGRQQLAERAGAGSGSISGEVATPENGLPMNIIVSAPSATPALPNRASSPATVAAMASTVRLSAAALAHQSPPTTSSQLCTISVAVEAGEDRAGDDEPARRQARGERDDSTPVRMPASTSGSTEAASAAGRRGRRRRPRPGALGGVGEHLRDGGRGRGRGQHLRARRRGDERAVDLAVLDRLAGGGLVGVAVDVEWSPAAPAALERGGPATPTARSRGPTLRRATRTA